MSYVSCELLGCLGDQLYQIANVIEYASNYNKIPIFKNIDFKKVWSTAFFNVLNVLNENEYNNLEFINVYENHFQLLKPIDYINTDKNIKFRGYFQSFKHLSENTRIYMRDLLYYNKDIFIQAYDIYNKIKIFMDNCEDDDMISLHIKRNDMQISSNLNKVQTIEDYYLPAYKLANKKYIIVFSDDIEWCKKNITTSIFTGSKIYFIDINNNSIEFILLSLFKNNIISNSTFSLWASYISFYETKKIIISPSIWFSHEGPKYNDYKFNDITHII